MKINMTRNGTELTVEVIELVGFDNALVIE